MASLLASAGWIAKDITGADGYWNESGRTKNYPVVRAKTDHTILGGSSDHDAPRDIVEGYCGFMRWKVMTGGASASKDVDPAGGPPAPSDADPLGAAFTPLADAPLPAFPAPALVLARTGEPVCGSAPRLGPVSATMIFPPNPAPNNGRGEFGALLAITRLARRRPSSSSNSKQNNNKVTINPIPNSTRKLTI